MRHTRLLLLLILFVGVPLQAERKPLRGTPPERLRDLVRKEGRITVIVRVGLDEPWKPEGHLTPPAAARQRAALRMKKDLVLTKHKKTKLILGYDYDSVPAFSAEVGSEALEKLIGDPDVESISENRVFETSLAESIPIINADDAWTQGYSGSGQVIAIIDTGFKTDHPFLQGRVVGEACFTRTVGSNEVQMCPSGTNGEGEGTALPCTYPPDHSLYPEPAPGCEHGTRVAGIAAGRAYGSVNFSGVAKDASFYLVKAASVTRQCTPSQCPFGWKSRIFEADALMALEHIYSKRTTVNFASVNLSFQYRSPQLTFPYGADCDDEEQTWANYIDLLTAADIAVVAGSGNDSTSSLQEPGLPACISNAITVGATTNSDAVAPYSNRGTIVDLLAPGGDVTAGAGITTSDVDGGFAESYGTSFAAPHVAGAFAILRQRSATAPVSVLRSYLVQTGVPVTDTRHSAPPLTTPRIDVDAALDLVDTQAPSPPGFVLASAVSTSEVSVTWTQSTDNVSVQDYVVQRKEESLAEWTAIGTVTAPGTSFSDLTATAAKAYAYRVVARDAALNPGPSSVDYATTVMHDDDPIQQPYSGTTALRGVHIATLRQAVDAWRVYAGLAPAFTYEAPTGFYAAAHVSGIVSALDPARIAIGMSAFTYSSVPDPASNGPIEDEHIQELRDAMK